MRGFCKNCGQKPSQGSDGQDELCPHCGTLAAADCKLEPDSSPTPSDDQVEGIVEVTSSDIARGAAKTISGLIRKRGISKVTSLDSTLMDGIEEVGEQKYRVGDQIAAGGMGAILDAQDCNLRRRVAMKVMKHPERVSNDHLARFISEAQITGQLQHPGIVPVHELGVDSENRPFYTMKLLKGRTLQSILDDLRKGDPETVENWPLSRLLNAFIRVCEALQYAHSKQVIHRDLKPENIMTGSFGEVQVLDWGLAKVLRDQDSEVDADLGVSGVFDIRSDEEGSQQFQSMDGTVAGTPHYMAPEQAAGLVQELDQRTDIYALGAILYQMLALERPVHGKTVAAILSNVRKGAITSPESCADGKFDHCPGGKPPSALCAIAMKALARDPEDRYQTVRGLAEDLEAYQNGFAAEAEHAGAWKRATLFAKRHKVVTIFSALLLSAILLGSIVSFQQSRRAVSALALANSEEEKRVATERDSAEARLRAARVLIKDGDYDAAEATLASVRKYAPQLAPQFDQAILATRRGLATTNATVRAEAFQEAIAHIDAMEKESNAGPRLRKILVSAVDQPSIDFPREVFAQLVSSAGYEILAISLETDSTKQLEAYRAILEASFKGQGVGLTHDQNGLLVFNQVREEAPITTLGPFTGMPLVSAHFTTATFKSLEPLRGMPLEKLEIRRFDGPSLLEGLGGLEGSPLRVLMLTEVKNLASLDPLRDCPHLTSLGMYVCSLKDISALRDLRPTSLLMSSARLTNGEKIRFSDLPLESLVDSLDIAYANIAPPAPEEMRRFPGKKLYAVGQEEWLDLNMLKQAPNIKYVSGFKYDWLRGHLRRLLGGDRIGCLQMLEELNEDLGDRAWAQPYWFEIEILSKLLANEDCTGMQGGCFKQFKGSQYYIPSGMISWSDSVRLAEILGGHLAVCETASEAAFLQTALRGYGSCWFGGRAIPGTGMEWINKASWTVDLLPPDSKFEGPLALQRGQWKIGNNHWKHPVIELPEADPIQPLENAMVLKELYRSVDPEPLLENENLLSVTIGNPSGFFDFFERQFVPMVPPQQTLEELIGRIQAPGLLPFKEDLQWILGARAGADPLKKPPANSILGLFEYSGRVYLPVRKRMRYPDAERLAVSLGAHLVCNESKEKQDWLLTKISEKNIWLGGSDAIEEGNWAWNNGTAWEWDNWNEGAKNKTWEDHLVLRADGAWLNVNGNSDYLSSAILEWTPGNIRQPAPSTFLDALVHCVTLKPEEYRAPALQRLLSHTPNAVQKAEIQRWIDVYSGKNDRPELGKHVLDCRVYEDGRVFGCFPKEMSKMDAAKVAKGFGARLACLNDDQARQWVMEEFGAAYPALKFHVGAHLDEGKARWDNGRPWITDAWSLGEPNLSAHSIVLVGNGRRGAASLVPGTFDDDQYPTSIPLLQWGDNPPYNPNGHIIRSPHAQVELLAMDPRVTNVTVEAGSAFTRWTMAAMLDGMKKKEAPRAVIQRLRSSLKAPGLMAFSKDLDLFEGLAEGRLERPDPDQAGLISWLSFDEKPVLWIPNQVLRDDAENLAKRFGGSLMSLDTPEAEEWLEGVRLKFGGDRIHVGNGSIVILFPKPNRVNSNPDPDRLGNALIIWE